MRNRLINTIGRFTNLRKGALPILPQPTLSVTVSEPNEVSFDVTFAPETTGNIFQYADNAVFANPVTVTNQSFPFTLLASQLGQPINDYFFRVRGTAEGFSPSNFASFSTGPMQQTPVSVTNLQALEANNEVILSWQSNANIAGVVVERRTTGAFAAIGTTTAPTFSDATAVNGTTYEYRVVAVPINFNFVGQASTPISATPSGTPKLATPTGLQLTESGTNGTLTLSWIAVAGANSYDVLLNNILIVNQSGVSFEFTGLNVGQLYAFGVVAKAAGFIDSNTATRNYAPIDNDAEFLTPEQFGAEAYYKPLDGRRFENTDFPLINYEPLGNGTTRITAVANDGSGDVVDGVFSLQDVGKRFCGLDNNINPPIDAVFADLYAPQTIGARYANVTTIDETNGRWAIVDFEFNGGDASDPQPQNNGAGYIFFDNSQALTTAFAALTNMTNASELRLDAVQRVGYMLSVYVAPELEETNIAAHPRDIKITCKLVGERARVKFGIEDYYWQQINPRQRFFKNAVSPNALFFFSGYNNKFITHNVQWIAPHNYRPNGDTSNYREMMFRGNVLNGVAMVVNGENYAEWHELEAAGNEKDYRFRIGVGTLGNAGTYTGNGSQVLHDVDRFGFDVHINCHYVGAFPGGQKGGGTRGGMFNVWKDCTFKSDPTDFYGAPTAQFEARLTTDRTGINDTGDNNDPSTFTHLPSHCIEITSPLGTWFDARLMGGTFRINIIQIGKFIFWANNTRYNQIEGYYTHCYHRNEPKLITTIGPTGEPSEGRNTVSPKKVLVDWEIPIEGNVYTISRDYACGRSDSQLKTLSGSAAIPFVGMPFRNAIRTAVNWATVLQKYIIDFTADDLNYINGLGLPVNKKPQEFQIDDQFRLCAWVEVDNVTGLAVGQSVTLGAITATIAYIDAYYYTNRVVLKAASGNVQAATEISNGTVTRNVTSASTFDPTTIYTCKRKQAGTYVSNDLTNATDADGQTFSYYGGETSRGATYSALRNATGVNDGGQIFNFNNLDCYYYNYLHVFPDLPDNINGDDFNKPHFEVEVVTSNAQELYDGVPRPTRTTYRSLALLGRGVNNIPGTVSQVTRRRQLNPTLEGYGYAQFNTLQYADGLDSRPLTKQAFVEDFDNDVWPSVGEATVRALYNTGENTYHIEDCDLNSGFARVNNTTPPSTYLSNTLARFSKGWTLVNNQNMFTGQWRSAESLSTREQFERQRLVYEDNPSYEPDYADFEEIPYPPKLRLYGTDSEGVYGGVVDPTGQNIVRDSNAANAPDLPKTIKDILIDLGEI